MVFNYIPKKKRMKIRTRKPYIVEIVKKNSYCIMSKYFSNMIIIVSWEKTKHLFPYPSSLPQPTEIKINKNSKKMKYFLSTYVDYISIKLKVKIKHRNKKINKINSHGAIKSKNYWQTLTLNFIPKYKIYPIYFICF